MPCFIKFTPFPLLPAFADNILPSISAIGAQMS